jgi:uncharacterized protein YajQ (UPF0234 family)
MIYNFHLKQSPLIFKQKAIKNKLRQKMFDVNNMENSGKIAVLR